MAVKLKSTITLVRVDDGESGKGIVKSEVYYYRSVSNTTQTGGSWETTPPVWVDGTYYWQKIKTTFTDGTISESKPVCITGEKGSTGSVGTSVSSITTEFYLSSSKSTQTGGSWVTTMPTWSPGKYLWTRSKIIYTNPSSTKYTAPICDSSWEAVNELEVGGRNLITLSKWQSVSTNGLKIEYVNKKLHIFGTNTKTDSNWQLCLISERTSILKSGEIYTISTTEPLPIGLNIYVKSKNNEGTIINAGSDSWMQGNEKDRYKTFVTNKDINGDMSISIIVDKNLSNIDYTFQIKLEKGTKPTDWTPAPEDIDSSINDAQDTADNALNGSNNAINRLNVAEITIDAINKSISSLVTDQNGGSLMTQTPDGWTFNMGAFQTILDKTTSDITEVKGDVNDAVELANRTNQLANDIAAKTAYINVSTDESGDPCIELGKVGNDFKLRITNTSIDFMQGSQKIAYITNRSLYIQSSVVTDEMQIGEGTGFVWRKRSNGNMGLRHLG